MRVRVEANVKVRFGVNVNIRFRLSGDAVTDDLVA